MVGMFGINVKTNAAGISGFAVTLWHIVQAGITSGVWYSGINDMSIVALITSAGLMFSKDRDVTGGTKVQSSEGAKDAVL